MLQHEQVHDFEGLISLEDFADRTGYLVPEGPYDTLAGYLMAQLGQVPKLDDVVEAELQPVAEGEGAHPVQVSMRVSEMDGRRIAWVDITRFQIAPQAADE